MKDINTRYYLPEDIDIWTIDEQGKNHFEYEICGTYASKVTMNKELKKRFRFYTVDVENIDIEVDNDGTRFISFDVMTTKGDRGVQSTQSYKFKYYKNCRERLYIDCNGKCRFPMGYTPSEYTRINEILNKYIKQHDREWFEQKTPGFFESEYRWG